MEKLFIGIDFSKKSFDATVISTAAKDTAAHNKFDNNIKGFRRLLRWVKGQAGDIGTADWMFCGENTGSYGIPLSDWLSSKDLFVWIENAYVLKCSMGIVRDKSDKVDSLRIAQYAMRMSDKAKRYVPMSETKRSLRTLLRQRDVLVNCRKQIVCCSQELAILPCGDNPAMEEVNEQVRKIEKLIKEVAEKIRKLMDKIMAADNELAGNYKIIMSFKGISTINTAILLLYTDNFKRFDTPNKLACYWGVAPFAQQSGTSVNIPAHCSPVCDKWLKAMLTEAAVCAIAFEKNIKAYYRRLLERGKDRFLAMNNVKSKILHIVFAMVKSGQMYDENYNERKINNIKKRQTGC